MIIRSKAPLRLGLAGGGSDVSPYSDEYGGTVLNATIAKHVTCTIIPRDDGQVILESLDQKLSFSANATDSLPIDQHMPLHKGVYNRMIRQFVGQPLSLHLTTFSEAASGSGLGGSSTMAVAMIRAYAEWLNLPLSEYDIAHLAFEIERLDLGMQGGKQDQYAASFGGFNFIEFNRDKVLVNSLRIKPSIKHELESCMLIYFSGISRVSAEIISEQIENVKNHNVQELEAVHSLKNQAVLMKEALLTGNIQKLARLLDASWQVKKNMAKSISNDHLDSVIKAGKEAGALAGKISGAGGGGYLFFIIDPLHREKVAARLAAFGGSVESVHFTDEGAQAWII